MLFEYENIVIGSDVRALLFAMINEYPIFYTEPRIPHEYEFVDLTLDIGFLLIDNEPTIYKSFTQDFEFGTSKTLVWEKLRFLLSIEGLMPLSNLCTSIRYDGERLRCTSEYSKLCEIEFDKCFYFGDNNTYGLIKERKKQNARYKIYDKIAFHRGGKHDYDYVETGERFVEQAWFYSSRRICGDTGVKDVCVSSILTEDELNDPSYTQTMSNFKLLSIMEKNGLRGMQAGYNKYGKPRYYNFKTSHIERRKILIDEPDWAETSLIKKCADSLHELSQKALNSDLSRYKYLNDYST